MRRNALLSVLLVSISTLALNACGSQDTGIESTKTAAPMPPVTNADHDTVAASKTFSTNPAPLSENDTLTPVMPMAAPVANAQAQAASMPTALTPSQTEPLSMEARVARLEESVGSLRSDYDRIMPAFASLNTTNERIQTLLDQMEAEGKIPPAAAAARPAPAPMKVQASEEEQALMAEEPAKTVTKTQSAAPAPTLAPEKTASVATPDKALSNTVTAVRFGEHADKTRLVLDMTSTSKPIFSYDNKKGENVLMVDMPETAWSGTISGKPNSPRVAEWTAQKGANGGSALTLQLKKNVRVLSTEFLPSDGSTPSRLVVDIASEG